MTRNKRFTITLLEILIRTLRNLGDILFVIWGVHTITQFDIDPTYPVTGLKGLIYIAVIYFVRYAVHLQYIKLLKRDEGQ